MLNKNSRVDKLNAAGINTGKYFSVNLPEGLAPGATICLMIDENGSPVMVSNANNDTDPVYSQIIKDGYVRNTKLYRRFVMAQMFRMLNYKTTHVYPLGVTEVDGGFHKYLKDKVPYEYTLSMMLEEVRVLSKLEKRDNDAFVERSYFFSHRVIKSVLDDYMKQLNSHLTTLPRYKCKGVPYVKIKGQNIFEADLSKKVLRPLQLQINKVCSQKSYDKIYNELRKFVDQMISLPSDTPKSKSWIDAYKGAGAYYTLKNLLMYHNCKIYFHDGSSLEGVEAIKYLEPLLSLYCGHWWRMMGLLKKVIKDNNFDFDARMKEIYGQ